MKFDFAVVRRNRRVFDTDVVSGVAADRECSTKHELGFS
jgi:hypothetical protein